MRFIKIGTRRSDLAWAQASMVKQQIEKLDAQIQVELVGIETQGDRVIDRPLHQLDGRDFFSAEIDRPLLEKKTDISVHSLKDLSVERPHGIVLAAIPKREDPRDILLFSPFIEARLRSGHPIRIGSSSPRRATNLPSFLQQALPLFSESTHAQIEMVDIRGNVPTRIEKLIKKDSPYDGILLALAGLNRLTQAHKISALTFDIRVMVLPLSVFPTAPGQGALAIECRSDDAELRALLQNLNHDDTARAVQEERDFLAQQGGGCHQRFGVTRFQAGNLGMVTAIKGIDSRGKKLDSFLYKKPLHQNRPIRAWDGSKMRATFLEAPGTSEQMDAQLKKIQKKDFVFCSHTRAFQPCQGRLYTSGVKTWFKLAKRGLWVEGCADSFGVDWLITQEPFSTTAFLGLNYKEGWILTHQPAATSGGPLKLIQTYQRIEDDKQWNSQEIQSATHFYFASPNQFDALIKRFPEIHNRFHACGAGKTYLRMKSCGLKHLSVFPNPEEWRKWIATPLIAQ